MKRKRTAALLALVMILTMLPLAVLAAPSDFKPYTPNDLTAGLITPDETHPYGSALLTFKINSLPRYNDTDRWYVVIEKKIGEAGEWKKAEEISTDQFLDYYQTGPGVFGFEQLWVEDYAWEQDIPVSFRVRLELYDNAFGFAGSSPDSNTAVIGIKGSSWAVPELEKAADHQLIPDILSGADLTKPITREEFCELALQLYEKTKGTVQAPAAANPFKDTQNPKILKAYSLGITTGTSADAFTPNKTVNRQECATMLFRAIKAMEPGADYSIAGISDFPDQKDIDSWAAEGTKYMSKLGIIKGDSRGYFMPKASATREAAILMAVRTYEINGKTGSSTAPQQAVSATPAAGPADFSGVWLIFSDDYKIQYGLQIEQSGSNVTGYCGDYKTGVTSIINGTINGGVLDGRLMDTELTGYEDTFTLTLVLSDNGDYIVGNWNHNGQAWAVKGMKSGESYHGEGSIDEEAHGEAEF